jgi:hypothetical protein
VVYDWDHRIDVFAPDGTLLYSVAPQVPGSVSAIIENGAVDEDGTAAAAVRSVAARGPARGGIALFDRAGTQLRFFDTGEYLPTQVAFGPDHSIWTIGRLGGQPVDNLTADHTVLRNYARDGRLLGAFLPRASFHYPESIGHVPLVAPMLGLWELRVANQRVEAVLHGQHLWVETDLHGKETGRWNIAGNGRPTAVTEDGRAWHKAGSQLQVFDRSTGVWRTVSFGAPLGTLLGAEGDSLVFLVRHQNTLSWITAPAESPTH